MDAQAEPKREAEQLEVVEEGTLRSQIESFERASIDVQIRTAHEFPRSMAEFKRKGTDMVSLDQETAASCIYRRPVGKDRETGKQKIAEGMSIRMAEIVGACYGNLRVMSMIVEQTAQFVKCRAVAHDLESNFLMASEVVESTVDKFGNPYSPRQRVVVAKATLKKAARDATFSVVPRALCKPLMKKALEIEAGGRTLEQRRAGALDWIKSLKIDEKRVWEVLEVKGAADMGEEQLATLLGLKTAMNDGEATLDETFPPLGTPEAGSPPEGGRADPAAVRGKGGRRQPGKPADGQQTPPPATPPAGEPAKAAEGVPATPPAAAPAGQTPPPAAPPPAAPKVNQRSVLEKQEVLTIKGARILSFKTEDFSGKPGVIAEIESEPYKGTIYDLNGATMDGDKRVHLPIWESKGKLTIELLGRGSRMGVLSLVQKVTTEGTDLGLD